MTTESVIKSPSKNSFLDAINCERIPDIVDNTILKPGWIVLQAGVPYQKPAELDDCVYKTCRVIKVLSDKYDAYISEYDSIHGEDAYLYANALGEYMIATDDDN
jgi:hypothetical protein